MKILFDHTLSPRLARALHALVAPDHEVAALKDSFGAETEDSAWLIAGKCAVITAEPRSGSSAHVLAAWKSTGHVVFFLSPGWLRLSVWDQAQKIVRCFPRILQTAQGSAEGSLFLVSVHGRTMPRQA